MQYLLRAAVLGTAVSVASGCALRKAEPEVRPAATATAAAPADSLEAFMQKVRSLSSRPARRSSAMASVEGQDPGLAAALMRLAFGGTAERHLAAAERYRALGIADSAYQHYKRALALDPEHAPAHDGLARVWRDWGFSDLALGDAHRAVYYAPASAAAHNTMGTVFQALGQLHSARQAYERATTLQPDAVYALSNLCYLSFLHGEFDRAAQTCRSALAVDPAFLAARHNLALTHAASGRLDLARAAFMDAGEEALALFNMGIVHMAVRDYGRAAAAFDAASRANPGMNIARERASQARQLGRVKLPGPGGQQ